MTAALQGGVYVLAVYSATYFALGLWVPLVAGALPWRAEEAQWTLN